MPFRDGREQLMCSPTESSRSQWFQTQIEPSCCCAQRQSSFCDHHKHSVSHCLWHFAACKYCSLVFHWSSFCLPWEFKLINTASTVLREIERNVKISVDLSVYWISFFFFSWTRTVEPLCKYFTNQELSSQSSMHLMFAPCLMLDPGRDWNVLFVLYSCKKEPDIPYQEFRMGSAPTYQHLTHLVKFCSMTAFYFRTAL